jgi:hypothetical protein
MAKAGTPLVVDALRIQYLGKESPALSFETDAFPVAIAGKPYFISIRTFGGTPPLTYAVDRTQLPPGLRIDPDQGVLSGLPITPGNYRLDVEVFDKAGGRIQRNFTIEVIPNISALRDVGQYQAPDSVRELKDGVPAGTPPDLSNLLTVLASLPEGEWVQASVNAYSDVWAPADLRPLLWGSSNPTPDWKIIPWSGFAWDPNRGDLLLFGGGHAAYSGNEVYRWRGSTRRWERASLPSEIVMDDLGNFQAIDGWDAAPSSAHTYDTNMFFPHIDRFVVFGGAAYNAGNMFMREVSPTSARPTGPFFFDPAKADPDKVGGTTGSHVQRVAPHPEIVGGEMWTNRDMYVNIPNNPPFPGSYINSCTAYADENGKDVAYIGARLGDSSYLDLYKYTVSDPDAPSLDTIEMVGILWESTGAMTSCAYDPSRKLFVRTSTNNTPFAFWDLNTPGPDNKDVVIMPTDATGEFSMLLASNSIDITFCGLDFDSTRQDFLLWCGDGLVWALTPPASPSRSGWTIVKQPAPTLQAPNGGAGRGILGKWKYISNLDAFLGLQDAVLGNIWIYKPVGWVNPQGAALHPSISGFSPTRGTVGTSVTISGTNFSGAVSVMFNGGNASFVVNSESQIVANVPAAATTGPITVTTPGGTATSATAFTVIPNSEFIAQSVPSSMVGGQSYSVSISFKNTGNTTWTNTTGPGTPNAYSLGSQNPRDNVTWGLASYPNRVPVGGSVAPGATATFTFNVVAPTTPGTYDFQWQMVEDFVAWFGALTPNVKVSVTPPPGFAPDAQFVSQSVPTAMVSGQTYPVSITVKNTGNTTWTNTTGPGTPNAYSLGSQNPRDNVTWGLASYPNRVPVGASVAPGATATFTFNVVAPAAPGTYDFQWQMVDDFVAWFGSLTPNVKVAVVPPDFAPNAQFVIQNVPTAMVGGQTYPVSITLKNTGNTTWTNTTGPGTPNAYSLGAQNPRDNMTWGLAPYPNRVPVGGSVPPGATTTFAFNVVAPTTSGTYDFQWQMVDDVVTWFGALTPNIRIVVTSP